MQNTTVLETVQRFAKDLKHLRDKLAEGLKIFQVANHRSVVEEVEEEFNERFLPVQNEVIAAVGVHIRELEAAVVDVEETLEFFATDLNIAKGNLANDNVLTGKQFKKLIRLGTVLHIEGTVIDHKSKVLNIATEIQSLRLNHDQKIRPPVGVIHDEDVVEIYDIEIDTRTNTYDMDDFPGLAALLK